MLFRRRKPLRIHEKLHHFVWPKRGWSRVIRYYSKRLLRLSGSPHSIAAGFATGVALSATPFIGFHFLLCFVFAFLVRGNVIAAMFGTAVGNPLTFPFIWITTYEIGNIVLGWFGRPRSAMGFEQIAYGLLNDSLRNIWPIIEPMLIGSIPLAIVAGGISYVGVYYATAAFQSSRRKRFAIRRRELHGSHT
jgi:uncharacterized protein